MKENSDLTSHVPPWKGKPGRERKVILLPSGKSALRKPRGGQGAAQNSGGKKPNVKRKPRL